MTVFVLHNISEHLALNGCGTEVLYTLPDTALQRNGKPVFIPDFAMPCEMTVHLALRISRLGRTVSPRFAYRYWDAATVVPHFVAKEMLLEAQRQGLPWSAATGFDSALPVGNFIAKEDLLAADGVIAYGIQTSDGAEMKGTAQDVETLAASAIARISKYYMVRNGDMILLPAPVNGYCPSINTHVEGYVGDHRVLAFNIK